MYAAWNRDNSSCSFFVLAWTSYIGQVPDLILRDGAARKNRTDCLDLARNIYNSTMSRLALDVYF